MSRYLLMLSLAWASLDAQPKFEVASIKQNKSEDMRGGIGFKIMPGGRASFKNLPLFILIAAAYDVPFQSPRLSGGPDWIRAERYDIEATAPEGAIPTGATARERDLIVHRMLQNLLEERFKLVMHRATNDQPIYAVVVAKKDVKLARSGIDEKDCAQDEGSAKPTCHGFRGGQGRGLHSEAATIEDAATFVSNWSDRPVVDYTGIKTLFKFETPGWVPMRPIPGNGTPVSPEGIDDPLRPTLFAIFGEMGLKLEPRKGPVESFTIQSIERLKEP